MIDFVGIIAQYPELTYLYLGSICLSFILATLLFRYFRETRKIIAKYLGLAMLNIGITITFYLVSFMYYKTNNVIDLTFTRLIGLSNLFLESGIFFIILYIHAIMYRNVKLSLKITYFTPIVGTIIVLLVTDDFIMLRTMIGYLISFLAITLLVYIVLFAKYLLSQLLRKVTLSEIKLSLITHLLATFFAFSAILLQTMGKILKAPLFSINAVISMVLVIASLFLMYLPTTLPRWYIKLARRIIK